MIRSRGRRLAGGVCVLLAAVFILSAALYWNFKIRPEQERRMYPREYSELVEKYAFENSLPVELVFAVILTESSFRADALSSAGAKGLMQITDDTNDWISRMQGDVGWLEDAEVTDELFDPETNIRRGCYFFWRICAGSSGLTRRRSRRITPGSGGSGTGFRSRG